MYFLRRGNLLFFYICVLNVFSVFLSLFRSAINRPVVRQRWSAFTRHLGVNQFLDSYQKSFIFCFSLPSFSALVHFPSLTSVYGRKWKILRRGKLFFFLHRHSELFSLFPNPSSPPPIPRGKSEEHTPTV